jgi:hopanoid-associated phosphorylase
LKILHPLGKVQLGEDLMFGAGQPIFKAAKSQSCSRQDLVIAVTSLAFEAHIARGPSVTVLCQHSSNLIASLREAVSRGAAGLVSFGVAGGLAPNLVPGDWVVASGVWTSGNYFLTDAIWAQRLVAALPGAVHADMASVGVPLVYPAQKRALHNRSGGVAVDTESHIAARVAAENHIPFAVCRVVIDPLDEALPPAAQLNLREDGRADVLAVLGSLARQPSQLAALVRIAYHAAIARTALTRGRRSLGTAFVCPYLSALASPERGAAPVPNWS